MKMKVTGKNSVPGTAAIFTAILIALIFLGPASRQDHSDAWQVQTGEQVVRLHVRASGDSPEEQRFKMAVVARVRQWLTDKKPRYGDYDACLEFLQGCLSGLEKELQGFADETSAGLPIAVRLSRENFPLRTYGRLIYPAGVYTALTVTVGEGGGENWWCLLFPSLCLPPAGENNLETVPETLSAEKAEKAAVPAAPIEGKKQGGSIQWRSKIWELLKRPGQYIIEKVEQIFYN